MTTIAMGAGMLPIATGWSGDPSFRAPMGVAVIGGLLASTALSLFVVPVLFTLTDDLQQRFSRAWRRKARTRVRRKRRAPIRCLLLLTQERASKSKPFP